ncbi:uncharacterized protein isoform X6 [Castor canadensis]|uniref:Uncharacterized protein isoform X6 n=1 Tax=Castor canadensis TaxID=51338 RepID=A0AC58LPH5_CASCN
MDWGTVITGTCVSPDSSNWPQGMLHRKRRSSFPLQRFVIVRRLLFRSRRRRPGAPTMHLKRVAAPRHWMRDKLTDVFSPNLRGRTSEEWEHRGSKGVKPLCGQPRLNKCQSCLFIGFPGVHACSCCLGKQHLCISNLHSACLRSDVISVEEDR